MTDKLTNTSQWIEYKGKIILFADYSGVDMMELQNEVQANEQSIMELGANGHKNLLVLTDVRGCHIDLSAVHAMQSVTKVMRPYTKASAVVGVTKIRKVILDAINRFCAMEHRPFDTLEEAKEWLVSL